MINIRIHFFQNFSIFFVTFRDVRSLTVDEERVRLSKLPYLHYLRNHIGDLMVLYMELFGWGYGVFCCHAGEHLNKIIKTFEMTETNLDTRRFHTIVHLMRVKQF